MVLITGFQLLIPYLVPPYKHFKTLIINYIMLITCDFFISIIARKAVAWL
jgi:hypothetical protein